MRKFSDLMFQITDLSEEAFFFFMDGLKPLVKQELERHGVEELTKAMITAKPLLELGIKKLEKSESSKPKFKPNDNGRGDKDKPTKNGDGKTQNVQKAKLDKSWEKKKGLVEFFFCEGLHMVKDCPKRSIFFAIKENDELEKALMKLGLI